MASSGGQRAVADWSLIATWLCNYETPTAEFTLGNFRAAARAVVARAAWNKDFAALSLLAERGVMTPKMYGVALGNILSGRTEMAMDWFDARIPMTDVLPHINEHTADMILHSPNCQGFYVRYASPEIDSCLLLVALSRQRVCSVEIFKQNCRRGVVTRAACLARNGIVLHKASRWRGVRRRVFHELIRCCGLSPADLASVGLKWPKT
jgi:hypothetical protein